MVGEMEKKEGKNVSCHGDSSLKDTMTAIPTTL